MSQEYKISEERLLKLLEKEERLEALYTGGVDNWPWYYESLVDYLDQVAPSKEEEIDLRYNELAYVNLLNEFGEQKI